MSTVSDGHQSKWLNNRRFLLSLDDEFPDWIVTAAFYCALHAVTVLFATDQVSIPGTHELRNQILKRTTRYRNIWRFYHPLWNTSITARYMCPPNGEVSLEYAHNLAKNNLHEIEKSVVKLSGIDQVLPPLSFGGTGA